MTTTTTIIEHLSDVVLAGLKEVPGLGAIIEYRDRRVLAQQMQTICAQVADLQQIFDQLAKMPPSKITDIIRAHLQQTKSNPEQQAIATEIVQQVTQRLTRKLTGTQHLGQAVPIDEANFFLDLLPETRIADRSNQEVPHRQPPWILQQLLGNGGMGEVWLAQNSAYKQEAIKFCHDESQRALLQAEVDTLTKVRQNLSSHPHIVRLEEINLKNSPYWLAFEYVPGGTLLDLMHQRHLAWNEALQMMLQIVEGVAAAHALDIVHRDLKPANILLTIDGTPKVTDFGLGRVLTSSATATQHAMGTIGYASPEQTQGLTANKADDVYALGVIFGQLATHTLLAPEYLKDHLPHSRLPQVAQQLIKDCLLPRSKRLADAATLLTRLQQLPSILAVDQDLKNLQQQASQARQRATQQQREQFAAQLKAQEQAATRFRQEQVAKFSSKPAPKPAAASSKQDDKLATDWQQLQQLSQQPPKIQQTFTQEREQEQQRIATARKDALQQLGKFHCEPRDEEFEYEHEYEERRAQAHAQYIKQQQAIETLWMETEQENLARIEQARQTALAECKQSLAILQATHHPFQCHTFTTNDFSYNLDTATLTCEQVLVKQYTSPLKQLRCTFTITPISRNLAKLYRSNPELFQIQGELGFQQQPIAIVISSAELEIVGEGKYPATGTVIIEPDQEAIAKQAFNKSSQLDTEQGWENFIAKYPESPDLAEAKKRLANLIQLREEKELARRQRLIKQEFAGYLIVMCSMLLFTFGGSASWYSYPLFIWVALLLIISGIALKVPFIILTYYIQKDGYINDDKVIHKFLIMGGDSRSDIRDRIMDRIWRDN
ncbi:hypothetical protein TI03_02170 [Achromatium sp. WMS1]|nr:hypothetical protein TI03_02170 [Achromatium sp. WMS1]